MIGTMINTVAILVGSLLGLLLKKGIPEKVQQAVQQGEGLCVLFIGLSGVINESDVVGVIICMVVGAAIGAAVDIEKRLNNLGNRLEVRFSTGSNKGSFAQGFVTASLVFCVGAMAIVGAMESGLHGNHATLIAKSVLDGVFSIIFASSFGIGVAFSAVAVFVYQGAIALCAGFIAPVLTEQIIGLMSSVGGLLIAGIGLNMIYDKKIPVGNMLPAIFAPLLYCPIAGLF